MTYAYMLSDHEENGAKNVVITLDRGRLPALLEEGTLNGYQDHAAEARSGLRHLLSAPDDELAQGSGYNLSRGYSSIQLHVVELS